MTFVMVHPNRMPDQHKKFLNAMHESSGSLRSLSRLLETNRDSLAPARLGHSGVSAIEFQAIADMVRVISADRFF